MWLMAGFLAFVVAIHVGRVIEEHRCMEPVTAEMVAANGWDWDDTEWLQDGEHVGYSLTEDQPTFDICR